MYPDEQTLSVSQYLHLVNQTLGLIPSEQTFVVGEISDYRVSQGKWINFDIKDEEEEAKMSCFTTVYKLRVPLEDGMKVKLVGSPKVYERFGKFSFNVESVELVGEGALAKAYALLKQKLAAEGLFEESRKRALPRFPNKIGLITSSEAAAYGDFLRILNNRWGGVALIHIPVHVQGQFAVPEILAAFHAFEMMDKNERPDVLVLTRGGGSLEDLHAFNDEQVARAVFQSSIPVIVGVGHERDESLCDFVADVRASTPSNAAERVVPDRRDIEREIDMSTRHIEDALERELDRRNRRIEQAVRTLDRFVDVHVQQLRRTIEQFGHAFERFRLSLVATRQYIERNARMVSVRFENKVASTNNQTKALIRLFEQFDIHRVLERGFSITRTSKGIVKNISSLALGEGIHVQLAKGSLKAKVESIENSK